jgi:signal transduction histidine kinase/CheY-like chemotaxis protein
MNVLDRIRTLAWRDGYRFHVGLGLIFIACAFISSSLQYDELAPGSAYDWMVQHRFRTPPADPTIVIIDIDEKSLAQMSDEFGRWPWPRDIFASVLNELEAQKAQAVVFDILFSDPDRHHPEADRALADTVAHSSRSYFPVLRLNSKNDEISTIRALDHPELVVHEPGKPSPPTSTERTLALVFPYFASAVKDGRFGTFNISPDPDGVLRRQILWENMDGSRIVSLPMRLAHAFGWTLPDEKSLLLRWADKPVPYKTISFSDVFADSQKKNRVRQPDEFTGKIVLIGSTAPGLSDLKGTSLTQIHPGVHILATEIDNIKNQTYLKEMPTWGKLLATVGLLMLATWLSCRYAGMQHTFAFSGIFITLFVISYFSLNVADRYIDLTVTGFYLLAYFAIAKLHELYLAQKEKEKAQALLVESLRQSEKVLAQKVAQRTKELGLKNNQLNDALSEVTVQKEIAESANLAKSRFLAAASHDLRQPMHTISLLVGLLRAQNRTPEIDGIIGKIHASIQAMGGMFGSLLDISKFDAGAVKVNVQEFAIDELLNRLAINYEAQAHEKQLTLEIVRSRARVRSDPALLERILGNLVSNAIRYTGHGKVLVGCRRRGGMLSVQVWDTGIGIPESQQDKIFEEFFQLDNPERDRSKGLGLGLSIVKRSADLLGHPLSVRSVAGRGSAFSVELPLSAGSDACKKLALLEHRVSDLLAQAFVVVIEDDDENREATEALLRDWGCHVVGAGSASEVLKALQGHLRTPDLLISDYRLQDGLTGIQAIAEIRQWAEQPIPAILVTGDLATESLNMSERGIELLHKPVDSIQLHQLAEEILRRS